MKKAKGIQIYLKPGIEEDDILLSLWEICKLRNRPQEMFRNLLQRGLVDMVSNDEIPKSILDELNFESLNIQRKKQIKNSKEDQTDSVVNADQFKRQTSSVPERYFEQKSISPPQKSDSKPKAKNISEGLM